MSIVFTFPYLIDVQLDRCRKKGKINNNNKFPNYNNKEEDDLLVTMRRE